MEEFNTLEKVQKLFRDAGCEGNENCYFVTLKDTNRSQSGLVGGMEYPYCGLLINATEKGLGIFFLNTEKLSLRITMDKLNVTENSYFFLPNEKIKEIKIKRFALLDTKKKSIIIKTDDKKKHALYANLEEPLIPYHSENFRKFMEKYGDQ